MIISDQSPVRFSDPLPDQVDVVIIGAGVIGISTAWFLCKRGVSVFVCEKGRVAGEQSSRNWGWVRQQGRDAAELPIAIDSIDTWARLSEETGEDLGFTREGVLYLADDDKKLAGFEDWLEIAKQHQLDSRILTSAQVDELITDNAGHWRGALYTASDGRAEPFKAVPGIARAVQRAGGAIRENCAVRTIDSEAGRVTGVVTELGRIRAQSVVCAAGAWSSLFAGNLDIKLPQLSVRATVARTAPTADVFSGNAAADDIAFRRRMDGGYTVAASGMNEHFVGADSFRYFFKFLPSLFSSSRYLKLRFGDGSGEGLMKRLLPTRKWNEVDISPFEQNRVLNPPPSPIAIRQMHDRLGRHLPSLAGITFEEAWAGMIDVLPDVVPVMDKVDSHPGLFLATGFSGHGFGIGPGAGRVMADMVQGRPAVHDLNRFRLSRFTDGSKIIPGPGL
ncbi:MAG: FAD-binding oxidoreductase [Gammaproteobacteria bacterium]|nr:FAD-binding oxidoreductase [Gammaproteobacteria bacterium]